jgi:hypothetical protein
MNDDALGAGLFIAFIAVLGTIFLLGSGMGFDVGLEKGKNDGIVFCMEQPQKCKVHYDYLKLQENQK